MLQFRKGATTATWLRGGLYVETDGHGLVLDVPAAALHALDELSALPKIRAIALSGGRIVSTGGLVPLLCALEPHRTADAPLEVWSPLGEERGLLLADAWSRGWPDRFPLTVDTGAPGTAFEVDGVEVATFAIRRGEPRFHPTLVVPVPAVAFRVRAPDAVVAWVPGAAPGAVLRHVCRDADLAVVEVGVTSWPSTDEPWRMNLEQALRAGESARELWIVGDDGRLLGGEST